MEPDRGPIASLGVIGETWVEVTPHLVHHEAYTWDGLLTLLVHRAEPAGGPPVGTALICCGGALGGVLGPGRGLFHELGTSLARRGVATTRVGYRVPNDLERCVLDVLAAAELAEQQGAERYLVMGHSFGGAVAVQAGVALAERCAGVITLATQSAGCEPGEALAERGVPVLLLHGDQDTILPFFSSQMVQMITGGELVMLPGGDHRLAGFDDELHDRISTWIAARITTGPSNPSNPPTS